MIQRILENAFAVSLERLIWENDVRKILNDRKPEFWETKEDRKLEKKLIKDFIKKICRGINNN